MSAIKIIKREDPLKSIHWKDFHLSLFFENDSIEILRLEMNSDSMFEESYICRNPSIHFIAQGILAFESQEGNHILIKGDTIWFGNRANFKIKNLSSDNGIMFSVLFKEERDESYRNE